MSAFDRAVEGLDAEHRAAIERVLNNLGLPRDDPHALLFAASGYAAQQLERLERQSRLRRPTWPVLLALTLALVGLWTGLLLAACWHLDSWYAERYAARWRSETERLTGTLAAAPDLLSWAAAHPDAVRWLRTERARVMRDIDQRYAGPLAGSDAPYPCLDHSDRRFRIDGREVATCTVVIGWR